MKQNKINIILFLISVLVLFTFFTNFSYAGQGCKINESCNPNECTEECGCGGYYDYGCGRECCSSDQECCFYGCFNVNSCIIKDDVCTGGTDGTNDPDCCFPKCPSPNEVNCGQQITPTNGCGSCTGLGTNCGYLGSCTSNRCDYLTAVLNADITTPCINNIISSRNIILNISCEYCGTTISIDKSWDDEDIVYEDIGDFFYINRDINIDLSAIYNSLLTNQPLKITVSSNRNEIKDVKDTTFYDLNKELIIDLKFLNFYYCPNVDDVIPNDFDYYPLIFNNSETDYYSFYNNDILYNWEDCVSNPNIKSCTSKPTDCVNKIGNSYPEGNLRDADNDGEVEICYSRDSIQGGWLDLDVNNGNCSLMKIIDIEGYSFFSRWLDCAETNDNRCKYGLDTFKPINEQEDITGFCCGDDPNEKPFMNLKFKNSYSEENYPRTISLIDVEAVGTSFSCCPNDKAYCVDITGNCREIGFSYCLSDGKKAICRETEFSDSETYFGKNKKFGVWQEIPDDTCEDICERADVNKNEDSYGVVDLKDCTSIKNQIDKNVYDELYDLNKDGSIDNYDYDICISCLEYETNPCGNGILEGVEKCEIINNEPIFSESCSNKCENKKTLNLIGCSSCECTYEASAMCIKGSCGAECESDNDCGEGKKCDLNSCSCITNGCPVGTSLCLDNTCSNDCKTDDTDFMSCIGSPNNICELGEGCACEDCFNKQDSCVNGAVCGSGGLCQCDAGKTLCSEGICREDCGSFNTQDCVVKNGLCEVGEGCACSDCYYKQDGCYDGYVCDYINEKCIPTCVKTEDFETKLNDNKDNDCDGLIDEPEFYKTGLYIWDSDCNYFICGYTEDNKFHNITFDIQSNNFNSIKDLYLDYGQDNYTISNDGSNLKVSFKLKSDIDCLILTTDSYMAFDVKIDNVYNKTSIYLTQSKKNPITIPFNYSNPLCNLVCNEPSKCHVDTFFGKKDCSPEKCLFSCGGYWIDNQHSFDLVWPNSYYGDYCLSCQNNMKCSNYSNEYSCVYDPCSASLTSFGCKWNGTECSDAFNRCLPGTTLCSDGTCSQDCNETDGRPLGCIGSPNNICELGEGCACEDCFNKQDSCVNGAICSFGLCGCSSNKTLCNDGTCDETCENNGGKKGCINKNGICEFGEGCACEDCYGNRDSCIPGYVCDENLQICVDANILVSCDEGKALCNDGTCDETCENNGGKKGCINKNGICEFGEGCACEDCYEKQDSCKEGLLCSSLNQLCYKNEEELQENSCVDKDKDGFYMIDNNCIIGNDCDDNDKNINPNAIEICNNIDDNCDGLIDNECIIANPLSIDVNAEKRNIKVLDEFILKVELKNNFLYEFSNLELSLITPDKIIVQNNNLKINKLLPRQKIENKFNVIVKDYKLNKAELTLVIKEDNNIIAQDKIELKIEIPRFEIRKMPKSEVYKSNLVCYDLYYILNGEDFSGYADIELDIVNPNSLFGKSVIVDYIGNINIDGVLIEPFNANPYCVKTDQDYILKGYLYQGKSFKIINKVAESANNLR